MYGTLEIQQRLLTLLNKFDNICQANGIDYSLAFGSLLGAIRHKGFIPWDDDIDIMVNRSSYNKLLPILLANSELSISRELWIDRIRLGYIDPNYNDNATIDVFIIDNSPDSLLCRKFQQYLILFIQGMMKAKPNFKNKNLFFVTFIILSYLIGKLFSQSFKEKLFHSASQLFSTSITKHRACFNVEYLYIKKVFSQEIFTGYIRMPFEDIEVSCITGYDSYLHILYGNYMTPPAEIDRVPKHGYINKSKI